MTMQALCTDIFEYFSSRIFRCAGVRHKVTAELPANQVIPYNSLHNPTYLADSRLVYFIEAEGGRNSIEFGGL